MQRFQSPLLKVHALCEQQSRLAEIEVARALSRERQIQQNVVDAEASLETARKVTTSALGKRMQTAFLQGIYNHISLAADRLHDARVQLTDAQQMTQKAKEAFETVRKKRESLSKLLDKERAEYRKQIFREQQSVMDDGAVFRWNGPGSTENEVTSHG